MSSLTQPSPQGEGFHVRRPIENPCVELALIFRPCLRRPGQTPARRLHLPESELLWRAGRGFVVPYLPSQTGQPDNSPAFQRQVSVSTGISPTGTAELGRPSGTRDYLTSNPTLKCRAIVIVSLRDDKTPFRRPKWLVLNL